MRKVAIGTGAAIAGVATLGLWVTGALTSDEHSAPSAREAREVVELAYVSAELPAEAFCDVGASKGNCRILLQGAPRPPTNRPTVECGRAVTSTTGSPAGYALRLSGVDGEGNAYLTDVLAIRTAEGVRLMNPVFWVSASVTSGSETGEKLDVCAEV